MDQIRVIYETMQQEHRTNLTNLAIELWKIKVIPAHLLTPELLFAIETKVNFRTASQDDRAKMTRAWNDIMYYLARNVYKSEFLMPKNLKTYFRILKSHFIKYGTYKKQFRYLYLRKQESIIGALQIANTDLDLPEAQIIKMIKDGNVVGISQNAKAYKSLEDKIGFSPSPAVCYTGLTSYKFTQLTGQLGSHIDSKWIEAALNYAETIAPTDYPIAQKESSFSKCKLKLHPTNLEIKCILPTDKIPKDKKLKLDNMREDVQWIMENVINAKHPLSLAGIKSIDIEVLYPVNVVDDDLDFLIDTITESEDLIKILFIGQKAIGKSSVTKKLKEWPATYIDDSDDYGAFLTFVLDKHNTKDLKQLDDNITMDDAITLAKEFCGLEDKPRTYFNLAYNEYLSSLSSNELSHEAASLEWFKDLYQSCFSLKSLNMISYEMGIKRYMYENKLTRLIQFAHIVTDNAKRSGYAAALTLRPTMLPITNLFARAYLMKSTTYELLTDILISMFYERVAQPTGMSISMEQLYSFVSRVAVRI